MEKIVLNGHAFVLTADQLSCYRAKIARQESFFKGLKLPSFRTNQFSSWQGEKRLSVVNPAIAEKDNRLIWSSDRKQYHDDRLKSLLIAAGY